MLRITVLFVAGDADQLADGVVEFVLSLLFGMFGLGLLFFGDAGLHLQQFVFGHFQLILSQFALILCDLLLVFC